jgi:hypothetical protein
MYNVQYSNDKVLLSKKIPTGLTSVSHSVHTCTCTTLKKNSGVFQTLHLHWRPSECISIQYTEYNLLVCYSPLDFYKCSEKKSKKSSFQIFKKWTKNFEINCQSSYILYHICNIHLEKLEAQPTEPVSLTFHSALRKLNTDQDEMSNLHRGPSIEVSYQVSVHLDEGFQSRRFFLENNHSETRIVCGGHVC